MWPGDDPSGDYPDLLREQIHARGWVVHVAETDPRPVAYTIGLHDRGLPELVVTGLAPKQARWLLTTFVKRALNGRRPAPGDQVRLPAGTLVELVHVEHPDVHLGMAIALGGHDVTAVQLVWADGRGRWPWAEGFDDGHRHQPVFGARTQDA